MLHLVQAAPSAARYGMGITNLFKFHSRSSEKSLLLLMDTGFF